MIKNLLKYRLILLSVVSTLIFSLYYFSTFSTNYGPHVDSFQEKFKKLEYKLGISLEDHSRSIGLNGIWSNWKKIEQDPEFNFHVYQNDSLVFWNTNQLPIIRFADIHFPSDGIVHLQNGWYYTKLIKKGKYTICGSFLIKHDFSYENKDLINEFTPLLKIPFDATISLEPNPDYSIFSKDNQFLFSLLPLDDQTVSDVESKVLLLMFLTCLLLWFMALLKFNNFLYKPFRWIFPIAIIVLRLFSLHYVWFQFLHELASFDPSLYASNEWFPNFFEYLVNCAVIFYLILFIKEQLAQEKSPQKSKWLAILLFFFNFLFWAILIQLNKGLIEDSSIPLILDRLFELNFYSVLAILSIGALFYIYFIYTREVVRFNQKSKINGGKLAMLSLIISLLFFLYEYHFGHQLIFAALFPLIFCSLMIYFTYRENQRFQLGLGLTFLMIFSLVTALNLREFNNRKERDERELYADQLASEQDIVTELEYKSIVNKIKEDNALQIFVGASTNISLSDFEDGLERRIFNGFWEQYEMNFYLFNKSGSSLISETDNQQNTFNHLNEIIEKHGQKSEINNNIFFISDYTEQYSYIIRQTLVDKNGLEGILYCTLKSKKIPEKIGFPRLLISSKAKVFESLENYSIAKYNNGELITKYGWFNFPTNLSQTKTWQKENNGYYNYGGYTHFILQKSKKDVIILSSKNPTRVELLTSFSYLFTFYGILLLPLLFQFNYTPLFKRSLNLAVKIQLVLIGLVFVSLLTFGWGSGVFVRNQYYEYTHEVIREKLASVDLELRNKLGTKNFLSISEDGNNIEYLLQKFSKVFITDINLYDTKGFLLASSRPKIFNMGLLSEQMNPHAIHSFYIQGNSEFVHDEKIGKLNYASAYLPFHNHEGQLLGYLNLQHFGQQKEFENQIQKFLVAIINVFMLLLAISIILAIFISNWVTAPLRLLQDNFSRIRFGKHNQQISYNKDDEIGALVKDYNQKLEELEYTAQQLAQSERESAWREMAKQVAHEIKNPLTPMKLSIQQLLRVYDPTDPNSEIKLKKVANSVIEQIDALTKIANEFSHFAKMPKPEEVSLDLLPIIENVIEVFKEDAKCEILMITSLENAYVMGDKDQMIRTFNNLLKNSIQSIPEGREGKIVVYISLKNNIYHIEIQDNGIGISKDKRSKIFVPYFTTKTNGTGLGLAMVKQIIENHSGSIYFETEEEVGTKFCIELPKTQ